MGVYAIVTILICLSAAFGYLNQRFLKFPFVIGLFTLATVLSVLILSAKLWLDVETENLKSAIENLRINDIIIDYMLGFLLFAGALHTNWAQLKQQIRRIATFAIGGVLVSTVVIALLMKTASGLIGLEIDLIYCFLFGALISPTDPIAVLGILTKAGVPEKSESTIVGESLFNDGVGVVIFLALIHTLYAGSFSVGHFGTLFLQEAAGGILIGLGLGYVLHLFLKHIDHYESEVLLTLAFVMAGYPLANELHVSGALAMVVMGLMVGNYRQDVAMSDKTQEYVNKFWELLDIVLNSLLFIIIAFVLIVIDFKLKYILFGSLAVLIVLLSRMLIVYLPHFLAPRLLKLNSKEAKIITWGGLRGGLSLALALSLPTGEAKNILLIATYFCVLFSIIVQGLTIEKVVKHAK